MPEDIIPHEEGVGNSQSGATAASAAPVATGVEALEFIWSGQEGFFELARLFNRRQHFERRDALRSLDGMSYFAPLARSRNGSTKGAVAAVGNVIWADIDSRDALTRIDEDLVPSGLESSLVIDSGNKGFWVYLKLDRPIPAHDSSFVPFAVLDDHGSLFELKILGEKSEGFTDP